MQKCIPVFLIFSCCILYPTVALCRPNSRPRCTVIETAANELQIRFSKKVARIRPRRVRVIGATLRAWQAETVRGNPIQFHRRKSGKRIFRLFFAPMSGDSLQDKATIVVRSRFGRSKTGRFSRRCKRAFVPMLDTSNNPHGSYDDGTQTPDVDESTAGLMPEQNQPTDTLASDSDREKDKENESVRQDSPQSQDTPEQDAESTGSDSDESSERPSEESNAESTTTPVLFQPTDNPFQSQECSRLALGDRATSTPLFPEAEGHGAFSFAGSGRHLQTPCAAIYRVTTLADSGRGSLRACVEASGPRVCIFEVSGTIWARDVLRVRSPYLTVAGQTAPYPGIAIRASGFSIEADEVLLQHLRLLVGDDPRPDCCELLRCNATTAAKCSQDPKSRDGVKVISSKGTLEHVYLDHLSIFWALDEGFSLVPEGGHIADVSVVNSIIASGLDNSIHPRAAKGGHSKAVLISASSNGKKVNRVSFLRNILAHNAERNIRSMPHLKMEYINNFVYNWGRGEGSSRLIELANDSAAVHYIDLIGNLYVPGPESFCPESLYSAAICKRLGSQGDNRSDRARLHSMLRIANGLQPESRYYLYDNISPTRQSGSQSQWDAVDHRFYTSPERNALRYPKNRRDTTIVASKKRSVYPVRHVESMVSESAGARPRENDRVRARLMSDIANRTGRIINCVSDNGSDRCELNAGGWPNIAKNTIRHWLPQQPFADDNGDGYTNLENWLHDQAQLVE